MASWSSFLLSSARRSPTIGLAITLALAGAAIVAPGGCTLNTAGLGAGGSGGSSSTTTTTSTMISTSSSTTTSTSTTTTTATSTSTGPVTCTDNDDCKTVPGSCMKKVCKSSLCEDEVDTTNTPTDDNDPCTKESCTPQGVPHAGIATGMPCEEPATAGVCDGTGKCIACLKDNDCKTGKKASCDVPTHTCISCDDGIKNGSETDKDCGGICGLCPGTGCGTNGGLCASGNCVDKVCCNTTCTGDCQACDIAGSIGTCTNLSIGKVDASCPSLKACDGAGNCKLTSSNACANDGECLSGICNVGICRVQSTGACTDDIACGSGYCKNNTICDDCTLGSQCKSSMCSVTTCKAPGGAPCDVDNDCAGGKCQFNLCMVNDNAPCSTGADCRSGFCKNNVCTACGGNGDCPGNATCKSTTFGPNTCELPSGAYCINDGPCAAATGTKCLFTFPRKCQ